MLLNKIFRKNTVPKGINEVLSKLDSNSTTEKTNSQWNAQIDKIGFSSPLYSKPLRIKNNEEVLAKYLEKLFENSKDIKNLLSIDKDTCKLKVELTGNTLIIKNEKGVEIFSKELSDLEKLAGKSGKYFKKLKGDFEEIKEKIKTEYKIKNPTIKNTKELGEIDNKTNKCFNEVRKECLYVKRENSKKTLRKHEGNIVLLTELLSSSVTIMSGFTHVVVRSLAEIGNLSKGILMAVLGAMGLEADRIDIVSSKENISTIKGFFKKIGSRKTLEILLKVLLIITGIVLAIAAIIVLFNLPGSGVALWILFGGIGLYNIAAACGVCYGTYKLVNCIRFQLDVGKIFKNKETSENEKYREYMNYLRGKISVEEVKDLTEKQKKKIRRKIRRKISSFKSVTSSGIVDPLMLDGIMLYSSMLNNKEKYSEEDIEEAMAQSKIIRDKVDKAAFLTGLKVSAFLALDSLCLFGIVVDALGGAVLRALFWNAIALSYFSANLLDIKGKIVTDKMYTLYRKESRKNEKKTNVIFFDVVLNKQKKDDEEDEKDDEKLEIVV